MSASSGFIQAGAQLGLQSILVRPRRSIGDFQAQVTIEETHTDTLEITEHPVDLGAPVTDHAYKRPAQVTIKCGWSNSPTSSNIVDALVNSVKGTIEGVKSLLSGNSESQVKSVYENMLRLQADRVLIDVYTGKRVYKNMLVQQIDTTTSKETENALILTIVLRQLIIVTTKTLSLSSSAIATDKDNLTDPKTTAAPATSGAKQLEPSSLTYEQIIGSPGYTGVR